MNPGTIVVLAVLILAVGAVIRKMIKDKKAGKNSCSCGCEGCGTSCSLCSGFPKDVKIHGPSKQ